MGSGVVAAVSIFLGAGAPGRAPEQERPAYQALRQNEDWSALRHPALRDDDWDALKYLRLGRSGWFVTFGEAREG